MAVGLREPYDKLKYMKEWEISAANAKYKPPISRASDDMFSVYSFKWSDTEYSPKQLLDNFQHLTPFLIITTQGYLGRDEWMNTVASDEVYWVAGVITLPRLVVRNEHGAYFSVPITCKYPVIPLSNGSPVNEYTPISVKQLYDENTYNGFLFAGDDHHHAYQGAGDGEVVKFGALEIMDQYEERYMKVHSLCSGRIYHEPCVVPVYLPITMSIAADIDSGDHVKFYKTMLGIHRFTATLPPTMAFPNSIHFKLSTEITMYVQPPSEGVYDTLEPRYVKFKTKSRDYVQSMHTYVSVTLDTGPATMHPPLTPVKVNTSQNPIHKREPEPDKVRLPTPPPDTEHIDQRCGARGPTTYVYQMSRAGYYVVNVEPLQALEELVKVIETGIIPQISMVSMIDISRNPGSVILPNIIRTIPANEPMLNAGPAPALPKRSINKAKGSPAFRSQPTSPTAAPGITGVIGELKLRNVAGDGSKSIPSPTAAPGVASVIDELKLRNMAGDGSKSIPSPTAAPGIAGIIGELKLRNMAGDGSNYIPRRTSNTYVEQPGMYEGIPYDGLPEPMSPIEPPPPPPFHGQRSSTRGPPKASISCANTSRNQKYLRMDDVPADVSNLDCDDIAECLVLLNLAKYCPIFLQEQIDGSLLVDLDASVLESEPLSLTKLEAVKLIKFSKGGWRPKSSSDITKWV